MAYDYNLLFFPLAAVAVWDRRDPVLSTILLAAAVPWLQPFQLSVPPLVLMGLKDDPCQSGSVALRERLCAGNLIRHGRIEMLPPCTC